VVEVQQDLIMVVVVQVMFKFFRNINQQVVEEEMVEQELQVHVVMVHQVVELEMIKPLKVLVTYLLQLHLKEILEVIQVDQVLVTQQRR
jgi:hypothetical protein